MNIFKRLLKIGQAEIHAFVEKLEDPILLTEQGIQEMHEQLGEMTEAYVRARAAVIRAENKLKSSQIEALDYEEKAKKLLQMAHEKELENDRAESLALEALGFKKKIMEESELINKEIQSYTEKTKEINVQLEVLKFNISKWEKELTTLKAKEQLNAASAFANRQMAIMDNQSTIGMLEKMKTKAEEADAMTEAFVEIAKEKMDRDIDFALNNGQSELTRELEKLKRQIKDK